MGIDSRDVMKHLALFSQVALIRGGNFATGKSVLGKIVNLVDNCARNQLGRLGRSDSKLNPSPL